MEVWKSLNINITIKYFVKSEYILVYMELPKIYFTTLSKKITLKLVAYFVIIINIFSGKSIHVCTFLGYKLSEGVGKPF